MRTFSLKGRNSRQFSASEIAISRQLCMAGQSLPVEQRRLG
jgi:hypothetical protein